MKKIIINLIVISIFGIGMLSADNNSASTDQVESANVVLSKDKESLANQSPCCKNKGGIQKSCNKGSVESNAKNTGQTACAKEKCSTSNCCKSVNKTRWWKFWK